ncbi:MAG: isochorismatase family protein [Peptostreptococcales bacterium]
MNYNWLSDTDRKVIELSGFGKKSGLGKKPVIMVIDAQKKFVGVDKPILESMALYPLSIGEKAFKALDQIKKVIEAGRKRQIPIFYTTSGFLKDEMVFNTFAKKRIRHEDSKIIPEDGDEIIESIQPLEGDFKVHKRFSSAFFGTPLISFLNMLHCDTLIVTGFTTSGCIRAFVIDAASYNYSVAVVKDCVADRFDMSHESSLFDMNLKHADVVMSEDIMEYFNHL